MYFVDQVPRVCLAVCLFFFGGVCVRSLDFLARFAVRLAQSGRPVPKRTRLRETGGRAGVVLLADADPIGRHRVSAARHVTRGQCAIRSRAIHSALSTTTPSRPESVRVRDPAVATVTETP